MELILAQAPNLKAEAIFLLTNLFGYMEDAPNTTSDAASRSVQKHNIPAPLLQELFAPIAALEEDLRETIEKDPEALYPFFFVNSAQDNWLAWAYYTLEYQHVDFAHLDLSTRRRMLALTLNCSLPLLAVLPMKASCSPFSTAMPVTAGSNGFASRPGRIRSCTTGVISP